MKAVRYVRRPVAAALAAAIIVLAQFGAAASATEPAQDNVRSYAEGLARAASNEFGAILERQRLAQAQGQKPGVGTETREGNRPAGDPLSWFRRSSQEFQALMEMLARGTPPSRPWDPVADAEKKAAARAVPADSNKIGNGGTAESKQRAGKTKAAEAKAAEEREAAKRAAEAKAAEERDAAKRAAEAKAAKEREAAKRAAEAKAAEDRKAAEAKRAAEAKAAEEREAAKRAAEAKAAEERKAAEAKRAAEAKAAEDARRAAEAKQIADARAAEEAKRAAEAKAAEERRVAEAKRVAETKAAEERKAGEAKQGAAAKVTEERKAAEAKRAVQSEGPADRSICKAAGEIISAPGWYVVGQGDTLSAIAWRHYGAARCYRRIHAANRRRIRNAHLIYPCQRIYLPPPLRRR